MGNVINIYWLTGHNGNLYQQLLAAKAQARQDGYHGSSALVELRWGGDFDYRGGGRCLALKVRRS